MGFELRQLNPLEHFPEFRPFSKIAFLIGLIVLVIGVGQRASSKNPTIFVGSTLILFALSCHYVRGLFWRDPIDPQDRLQRVPDWLANMLSGLFCSAATLVSFLWLLHISLEPPWVKTFWLKITEIVW